MNIQLIDLKKQYESIKTEIHTAALGVLDSGSYILGPDVQRFENEIAEYCGTKYAIGVANGTDALLLTLDALGIGPGDEVITTPFTFFATAEVVSQMGATPVFIDIDPKTYNLDVSKIEQAITAKTKAIIPVHIFGQPANMDEILSIASKHSLHVVEDACQAIGSQYKGRPIGSMGAAGCFSFFPTKNLGGYGDGGIIVTNNEQLMSRLRILRAHGSNPKYYHSMIGYNSRLDPLQAAMLSVKLKYLDGWNAKRKELSLKYNEAFRDLPITCPYAAEDRKHVYHLYIIQTEFRNELISHLEKNGVASGIYYPVPLHRQNVYLELGYEEGSLKEAEEASNRTMALPLYPEMTEEEQQYVIDTVRDFFNKKVKS
ncbi:transcriptional regulator [Cohnella sp. CIP 111063]|uniref:DegT/DnrJ/EryC1/StrS family aminotransferase n=1 Tax=unclassified Cohnella TaxID=2636738 RepID=UPI000B8BFA5D|nr:MULTISPECIES: DegT/DnrJ/EryC1/StrS family aminotransferase [unclassified Cohnella]OXS55990.1 transcriptional regulator [Cohnella sp. CIP 111063]PRX67135.1 dTDP-4-amino-4,6-dideoxygalactose transaminase [Cohnella sp. SGD-V74]